MDYQNYEDLVRRFFVESRFRDTSVFQELATNKMYKALARHDLTVDEYDAIQTDIVILDPDGYSQIGKRIPSVRKFLERYEQSPNHAVLLAPGDAPQEQQLRELLDKAGRAMDGIFGRFLDLYLPTEETPYELMNRMTTLPGGTSVRLEHLPALFIWSQSASMLVQLHDADRTIATLRLLGDFLRDLDGPITKSSDRNFKDFLETRTVKKPVKKPTKKLTLAVLGVIGTIVLGTLTAALGNLGGTRDFICDLQIAQKYCASVFVSEAPASSTSAK